MKKLMYIFLVLSVLTGCKEKKDAGAMKGMPTLAISVAKPIVKDITLTKDYPGYLTTEKTVNLVARVNGTLQSVSYAPGGRVKKGQLLFVIEPTLYNDKVAQAEAELKTAQAQLEYARNNYSRMNLCPQRYLDLVAIGLRVKDGCDRLRDPCTGIIVRR